MVFLDKAQVIKPCREIQGCTKTYHDVNKNSNIGAAAEGVTWKG